MSINPSSIGFNNLHSTAPLQETVRRVHLQATYRPTATSNKGIVVQFANFFALQRVLLGGAKLPVERRATRSPLLTTGTHPHHVQPI